MSEYKCPKCNSVWNSSKSVTNCPFCGDNITAPYNTSINVVDMNSLIIKTKNELGRDAFSKENYQKKYVISYMLDYAPEYKKQIQLFKIALKANIYDEFQKSRNGNINLSRIKHYLRENYYLNDISITAIIDWFYTLFDLENPNKIETKATIKGTTNNAQNVSSQDTRNSIDPENKKIVKEALSKMYLTKIDEAYLSSHISDIQSLAESGDLDGEFYFGKCLYLGLEIKKDIDKAMHWYRKAAVHNHPIAQNNLGAIYDELSKGNKDDTLNYYNCISCYNQAQENGFVMGSRNLILKSLETNGVESIQNIEFINDTVNKGLQRANPNRYQSDKECFLWKYILSVIGYFNAQQAIKVISYIADKYSNEEQYDAFVKEQGEDALLKILKLCNKENVDKYISLSKKYMATVNDYSIKYKKKNETDIFKDEFVRQMSGPVLYYYKSK